MSTKLSRRDILKLLALLPPAVYLPSKISRLAAQNSDTPNILVLVFDSWSAKNLSLYGYPRQTTPNLEKLAEKAIVYHNHYAGGHFTIPGTASLLTGVQPWHHHCYNMPVNFKPIYTRKNIFGKFPDYHRLTYTHNRWAIQILRKLREQIDIQKPLADLLINHDPITGIFPLDEDIASVATAQTFETFNRGFASSAIFSRLWSTYTAWLQKNLADEFPRGIPNTARSDTFRLEDAVDWLAEYIKTGPTPALTYFHLLPPHSPYNTRKEFVDAFASDGYAPPKKPEHAFSGGISYEDSQQLRREYDEFILYVDAEIGRLFSLLENNPQADNTWVILTSDHGEIFERGMKHHGKPSMYDPLVKVPLMIFPPGQQERIDIHAPTSAVDILPTLLNISGKMIPDWAEGMALPPFNPSYPADRPIYVMDAKRAQAGRRYFEGSFSLRRDNYKLIYQFGKGSVYRFLDETPSIELYDLSSDPEEMTNLFTPDHPVGAALLDELINKLTSMNLLK